MASNRKKNKKKKNRRKKAVEPVRLSSPVSSSDSAQQKRQFEQRKLLRFEKRLRGLISGNRFAEAQEQIAGKYPGDSPEDKAIRLGLLLKYIPDVGIDELITAPPPILETREIAQAVANSLLRLNHEKCEKLLSLNAGFVDETKIILRANQLIFEQQDEAAIELLSQISIRSPFREPRLFLSALSYFYRGMDHKAHAVFSKLSRSEGYEKICSVFYPLTAISAGGIDCSDNVTETADKGFIIPVKGHCADATDSFSTPRQKDILLMWRTQWLLKSNSRVAAAQVVSMLEGTADVTRHACIAALLTSLASQVSGKASFKVVTQASQSLGVTQKASAYGTIIMIAEKVLQMDPAFCATLWVDYADTLEDEKPEEAFQRYFPQNLMAFVKFLAAIRFRACELFQRQIKFDSASWNDDIFYDDEEDVDSGLHEVLKTHFARLLALEPGNPKYWSAYIEFLKDGDKKVRNRAVEDFVGNCPQDPRALELAANEAHKRKAYDKALKYIQRALDAEPMNRPFRRLQCTLLVEKARKKISGKAYEKASELYSEAMRIDHIPPLDRLGPVFELVLFERWYGGGLSNDEIDNFERIAIATSPGPWSLEAEKAQSAVHLEKALKKKKLFGVTLPDEAPTPSDMTHFIRMFRTNEDFFTSEKKMISLWRTAIDRGCSVLTQWDDLLTCLKWCENARTQLSIIERVLEVKAEVDEKLDVMVVSKYELALRMKESVSYFDSAISELDAARRRENGRTDEHGYFYSNFVSEIDSLEEKIKRYIATEKKKASNKNVKHPPRPHPRQKSFSF